MHPSENQRSHRRPRRFFLDLAGRDVVLVAGSGRSGTTWLMDLINYRGDHRAVFEPFWKVKVPLCRQFERRQYLRPDNTAPGFLKAARSIVYGRLRNTWTDKRVYRRIYRRRLIKDIRANLLLGWLHRRFPFVKIVYLMRHPCAVAVSQLKMGWRSPVADLLDQSELVNDHLEPFEPLIRSAEDNFERRILLWCADNYVPLRQFRSEGVCLVFYEELVSNPEPTIDRLFGFLSRPVEQGVFAQLEVPSRLCREDSAVLTGEDRLAGWRKDVGPDRMARAGEILAAFGLDGIYGPDPLPRPEAALRMLAEPSASPGQGRPGGRPSGEAAGPVGQFT